MLKASLSTFFDRDEALVKDLGKYNTLGQGRGLKEAREFMPTIAIIGASQDRNKFGNKAIRVFVDKGYEVYPVNPKLKEIEGLKTYPSILDIPIKEFDMVSFYLPPEVGLKVISDVAKVKAKEVWFNPGSESDALIEKAESLGLNVIAACSIVNVGSNPSKY